MVVVVVVVEVIVVVSWLLQRAVDNCSKSKCLVLCKRDER